MALLILGDSSAPSGFSQCFSKSCHLCNSFEVHELEFLSDVINYEKKFLKFKTTCICRLYVSLSIRLEKPRRKDNYFDFNYLFLVLAFESNLLFNSTIQSGRIVLLSKR